MKVFILPAMYNPVAPFARMFTSKGWGVTQDVAKADLIQFVGGSDVTPSLYRQLPHRTTRSNARRDRVEKELYDKWVGKKPMAGVCRGAQFLWVMDGGKLHQDVQGHKVQHELFSTGSHDRICMANSTHHQAMKAKASSPRWDSVLAYSADNGASKVSFNPAGIEVAMLAKTRALCFQPHPEHSGYPELTDYYFKLIWNYLVDKG
jgi:gamma-glutamyl-gamma-aminobutyrate hydrolase PuuD